MPQCARSLAHAVQSLRRGSIASCFELLFHQSAPHLRMVHVGGQPVSLAYAYAPGEEHDGVTIELPFTVAQTASPGLVEWAVPGLREEMINELLRALP